MSLRAKAINRTSSFPQGTPDIKTRSRAEAGTKERYCRPLPKEFRRDGFQFRQIAREGDVAIFEQTWLGCAEPSVAYEVIRIRRRDGFWIDGRFVEPAEVYPNSEAWGVDGFTVQDQETAFRKLHKIVSLKVGNRPC
jgi:hypothetical protein